ncbi:hypothetical protein CC80DRAFT_41626 [Byssothecium circinans]|uniref:Nephrocystin 3-like N-terminal domain-containing protein n=1 Tax=Byssothecium circinans TaxID=147558 RepID=A0A6A5TZZ3_9PLEO|nr:hypothetical protein CC80DRAFT_41626 [Byssothecium circinans]
MVIQHLLETDSVAFFYISANASVLDPSRTVHNDVNNIFQSILAQCSIQSDGTVASHIQSVFDSSDRQSSGGCDMTLSVVLSNLKTILHERGEIQKTFVFDALDECKEPGKFLEYLADVMKAVPKLRVFISTHFGLNVGDYFDSPRLLSVGEQNSADINSYVNREVGRRGKKMTPHQAERLKRALNKQADGVFRWIVLELDIFFPRTQRQGGRMLSKDVDRKLSKLESSQAPPVGRLFEAYEELYKYALG